MSDPARFLPIVYDPVIADACMEYGHIYRQSNGMYITLDHKGQLDSIIGNWPHKDVRGICVTNGGRILGLGDIGALGMCIPIGKLQLYTGAAAVPPEGLMPVFMDLGTDNESIKLDSTYLGLRRKRPHPDVLYEFVDEFVTAVNKHYPHCCIHFEDWTGVDAVNLLDRYRDKTLCYNDDIQGTGSITLAGMLNAMKIKGTKLEDEKILFCGAGSAAYGLAMLLITQMVEDGLTEEEALSKIYMFDIDGLVEKSRIGKDLFKFQEKFAKDMQPTADLEEVIRTIKPTALLGVSTAGGRFTQRVVEAMSEINERPIIFALSNPTSHVECTAEQAYKWSKGKAIYSAGVQFPPVNYEDLTFLPGQCNNSYVFPAVSLAIYVTKAKRVTDDMFIAAARATANLVSDELLAKGALFPLQANILECSIQIATKVAENIFENNLAQVEKPTISMEKFIREHVYIPEYRELD